MEVEVNYLAVALAAISSMAVGSVWYARPVFGNLWIKLAKPNMNMGKSQSAYAIGVTFLVSLVTAYVLAHVTYLSNAFFGHSFLQDAFTTAFWLWLGLTAARFITYDAFEGRRKKLTLLNIAHELVTLLIMAVIIGWLEP